MDPHFVGGGVTLYHGDCIEVLAGLPDACVDSIVTDPPYGLGFMGREWDDLPPGLPFALEALRVLKPGGFLLAFGGTRTWHRLAVAVEDAGFEIRDSIAWLYGSGFPKSRDVSEAMQGFLDGPAPDIYRLTAFVREARDRAGWSNKRIDALFGTNGMAGHWTTAGSQPAVPSRRQWEILKAELGFGDELDDLAERLGSTEHPEDWGTLTPSGEGFLEWRKDRPRVAAGAWGTALKPAFEPVVVGRKPTVGSTTANVAQFGTGALNIAGTRVGGELLPAVVRGVSKVGTFEGADGNTTSEREGRWPSEREGRWPSNVALDPSQAAELDRQAPATGGSGVASGPSRTGTTTSVARGEFKGTDRPATFYGGERGGASRFFPTFRYEAKAPTFERPKGDDGVGHPTVKPLELMQWLVRLVTPPGGVVLEPFAGSGTTVEACLREGFECVAIEREASYLPLILKRVRKDHQQSLFGEWEG